MSFPHKNKARPTHRTGVVWSSMRAQIVLLEDETLAPAVLVRPSLNHARTASLEHIVGGGIAHSADHQQIVHCDALLPEVVNENLVRGRGQQLRALLVRLACQRGGMYLGTGAARENADVADGMRHRRCATVCALVVACADARG